MWRVRHGNCRKFEEARDARGRPNITEQSYNGLIVNCPSCQRQRRSADLSEGREGPTFNGFVDHCFQHATEPRWSWATLATSASTTRDWNSPRMFEEERRLRYFRSSRQRSSPWNGATLRRVRYTPPHVFSFIRKICTRSMSMFNLAFRCTNIFLIIINDICIYYLRLELLISMISHFKIILRNWSNWVN